jgi:hypothetical protein
MHPQRKVLAAINVIGGMAVLASYGVGLAMNPGNRHQLWGEVPAGLRPTYTVSMVLAALGYFAFTYYIFFRLDPARTRIGDSFGYGLFNWIYAGILFPSALWMPLTFATLANGDDSLWTAIRVVLTLVGVSSLALVAALLAVEPRERTIARGLAVLGAIAFAVQTALLDALVWPTFFTP